MVKKKKKTGRKLKFTDKELEKALIKYRGFHTRAALSLGCRYETVGARINKSKALQAVCETIKESNKDMVENVLMSNIALAERKANRINEIMEGTNDVLVLKTPIDKDGCDVALKVAKYKLQDRGYVDKQEITGSLDVRNIEVTFVEPGAKKKGGK